MKNYLILLYLTQLSALVFAQCRFRANEALREKRIVAFRNNGQLQLLNKDTVGEGTKLYYICSNEDVIKVQCNRNRHFSRTLPVNECDNPMKAVVQEVQDKNCHAESYRIGYPYRRGFLELYRSCYDTRKMRALYTNYTAHPFRLRLARPDGKFKHDDIMTEADAATFSQQSILRRLQHIFGRGHTYVSSDRTPILINRGHLVPSSDFLFVSNSRATFKLLNVVPQFNKINNGNWLQIERWVKSHAPATVRTGAFGVLRLLKTGQSEMVPVYLQKNHRNPVPEWTYKIVKNSRGATVFLTYNNVFNDRMPDTSRLCQRVNCPHIRIRNTKDAGFTICCNPQHFETTVLPTVQYQS